MVLGNPRSAALTQPIDIGDRRALGIDRQNTGTTLFFAPLVWLGFTPLPVSVALEVNLLCQFWLHTTWIPKLGH